MLVIDAQLHEPPMALEWPHADHETRLELMTEVTLAYMRSIGVERAVLHPICGIGWGEYAVARMPDRFTVVVGPVVVAPNGSTSLRGSTGETPISSIDEWVAAQRRTPGVVGIRLSRPTADLFEPVLAACAREGLPVLVLPQSPSGNPREFGGDFAETALIAERFPELTIILDHLGLPQWPATLHDPPFRELPGLLALAAHPNVAIKFAGAPAMSHRPYPYDDLWPSLRHVVDAFGAHRLMWGSDYSRFYERIGFLRFPPPAEAGAFAYRDGIAPELLGDHAEWHTYAESLFHLRAGAELSAEEKEWILGRTAQTLLHWPLDAAPAT